MRQKREQIHLPTTESTEFAALVVEHARLLAEEKKVDRKIYWVTLCSAIVAVLATGAAIWSAFEAHRTRNENTTMNLRALELQQRALYLDERPYLRVAFDGVRGEPVSAGPPDSPIVGKQTTAHLRLFALGKTPSYEVTVTAACAFTPNTYGKAVNAADSNWWSSIEAPQHDLVGTIFPNDTFLYPHRCKQLEQYAKSKNGYLQFSGEVGYKDNFGRGHRTPFCFRTRRDVGEWNSCYWGSPVGQPAAD